MPRLSIVIPVWGKLRDLEDTLLSVLENRPEDSEILVVLDEDYADPYDLKDEIRFLQTPLGTGLAAGVNLAIDASRGEIVHLLMCGARVREGWCEPALARFDDPDVAAVAPVVLDLDDPGRMVAAGATFTPGGRMKFLGRGCAVAKASRYARRVDAPHLAAGFFRRSSLDLVGQLPEEIGDRLAVMDLALTFCDLGFATVLEPQSEVLASAGIDLRTGHLRRSLDLERLFWRWSPQGGWLWALACHSASVAGELLAGVFRLSLPAQLTGRFLGAFNVGAHRSNQQRIRQLLGRIDARAVAKPHYRMDNLRSATTVR